MTKNISFSFLTIGKTKESTEGGSFKRYIGIGSTKVLAVNPKKAELDQLLGYETQNEPEYTGTDDNGKFARVTFVVRTDPDSNNGIDLRTRVTFTLRNKPAYNRDETKVQVIDIYGNSSWAPKDVAEKGGKILSSSGEQMKIATGKYRIACQGEADLVSFLKTYLCMEDAFTYKNGQWELRSDDEKQLSDYRFSLDNIKDYFNGDFSEVKDAVALKPNNKVKLLFGVRTSDDGKQYQTVATKEGFVLRNNANAKAYARLERNLNNAKQNGSYANTEFKVEELQQWSATPTNFQEEETSTAMPWD